MENITLVVKWTGQDYTVELPTSETVLQFKERLTEVTGVQTHRQKLLSIKYKGTISYFLSLPWHISRTRI